MEELKSQALDMLAALSEEQVRMVLDYARSLRDGQGALSDDFEDLLEQTA
jgi:hypothetical protein